MDFSLRTFKVELKTDRFLLRPFVDGDLEHVYRGLSHPQVIKYYGVRFDSLEGTKEQMSFFSALESNDTGRWWAICAPDETVFYGGAGLNNVNKVHKKAEIGFWLMPEYWGQGIISEVLPKIIEYGFEHFSLHRIEAFIETGNENSIKAIQKLGFEWEGTMKDCEIKDGAFISLHIYAKLSQ